MAVRATTVVTIEQAREWCLQDQHDTSRDEAITLAADAASERLERDTSRVFKARTLTEFQNGDGEASLIYLRRFPVVSFTSLTVGGELLDASRYVVDAEHGRVLLTSGRFPQGVQNIVALYSAGYADADLPADVVELALQLTARLFKMRARGGSMFEQVSVGGNSFAVRDQLPTDMVKAIERLRDKRFG